MGFALITHKNVLYFVAPVYHGNPFHFFRSKLLLFLVPQSRDTVNKMLFWGTPKLSLSSFKCTIN